MKKSYMIAIIMSAVIVVWMATGMLNSPDKTTIKSTEQDHQLILVETQLQKAKPVQLRLTLQGQVEPRRKTSIRSDLDGRVTDIFVKEGDWIKAGTVIFCLDPEDREIKLARENALLLSKQQNYQRSKILVEQNLQPKSSLENSFAELKMAEASVAQIKLEMSKLNITSPFDGFIDYLAVEQSSYINANSDVGKFIDNSQLTVVVPVAQQDISKMSLGLKAKVRFATGESKTGVIQFISSLANENTRTFRVEININNTDMSIPAGISAEVDISMRQVEAHFVSPAILSLDAAGEIGIKSVDENNTVVFTPITIIKSSTQGIWVGGLPSEVNIITIGQGFVEAGAKVNWEPATDKSASSTIAPKQVMQRQVMPDKKADNNVNSVSS
jgi:multidrug efflux system membrane fusion protein